jgi:hypothetical protein
MRSKAVAIRLVEAARRNGMEVIDVCIVVDTWPRWKRALAWLVWRCPILCAPARFLFKKSSPYRRVVAIMKVEGTPGVDSSPTS